MMHRLPNNPTPADVLRFLLDNGGWYLSAIELDSEVNGESLEEIARQSLRGTWASFDALADAALLSMSIDGYRSQLMKLPEDLLRDLCRSFVRPGFDGPSGLRRLGAAGHAIDHRAFYRFWSEFRDAARRILHTTRTTNAAHGGGDNEPDNDRGKARG